MLRAKLGGFLGVTRQNLQPSLATCLLEQVSHVELHSSLRDEKLARNLGVGLFGEHEAQYVALAGRQTMGGGKSLESSLFLLLGRNRLRLRLWRTHVQLQLQKDHCRSHKEHGGNNDERNGFVCKRQVKRSAQGVAHVAKQHAQSR